MGGNLTRDNIGLLLERGKFSALDVQWRRVSNALMKLASDFIREVLKMMKFGVADGLDCEHALKMWEMF